jgi:hypothetical protein
LIINGNSYAISPGVLNTLQKWPAHNARVIGSGDFPDFAFGQSVIHSVKTGEWLRQTHSHRLLHGDEP